MYGSLHPRTLQKRKKQLPDGSCFSSSKFVVSSSILDHCKFILLAAPKQPDPSTYPVAIHAIFNVLLLLLTTTTTIVIIIEFIFKMSINNCCLLLSSKRCNRHNNNNYYYYYCNLPQSRRQRHERMHFHSNGGIVIVLMTIINVVVQIQSSHAFVIRTTLQQQQEQQQSSSSLQYQQQSSIQQSSWHIKWSHAEKVEDDMMIALQQLLCHDQASCASEVYYENKARRIVFPSVRSCNTALATFGDSGDYLRALRLFLKMKKCSGHMIRRQQQHDGDVDVDAMVIVPAPTLVTYSTMMSRALTIGNPHVALRLWNLMKLQADFFSTIPTSTSAIHRQTKNTFGSNSIVPDVKAANILLNVYAKLADVDSAWYILDQMIHGNGTDVPKLTPNLVTYNTLLDACAKARDLDAALCAKERLVQSGLRPDARTFTTLISTVARTKSQTSGAHDVTLAFAWLQEMIQEEIVPNGKTYSALIDACGRAGRPDLALKGLRTMLRQKHKVLNEVGAWTAAINVLGRAGRMDTAMRLFYTMPKFDVQPNTVTCGCLADCLLRTGKIAETLDVLRYMKRVGIAPNEVIYTSLMSSAERLVKMERKNSILLDETRLDQGGDTKAIEVYTELMKVLMETTDSGSDDSNTLLMKVFLVFQEMKTVGAQPDLACYNALLRACAREGDLDRAQQVMRRLQEEGLHPNDKSWRELVRAAAKMRRSDLAEAVWEMGRNYKGKGKHRENSMGSMVWKPTVESFGALVNAYLRESHVVEYDEGKRVLLKKIIVIYRNVLTGSEGRYVDRLDLMENCSVMLMILQAVVALEKMEVVEKHKMVLRHLGTTIAALEGVERLQVGKRRENTRSLNALRIARGWLRE